MDQPLSTSSPASSVRNYITYSFRGMCPGCRSPVEQISKQPAVFVNICCCCDLEVKAEYQRRSYASDRDLSSYLGSSMSGFTSSNTNLTSQRREDPSMVGSPLSHNVETLPTDNSGTISSHTALSSTVPELTQSPPAGDNPPDGGSLPEDDLSPEGQTPPGGSTPPSGSMDPVHSGQIEINDSTSRLSYRDHIRPLLQKGGRLVQSTIGRLLGLEIEIHRRRPTHRGLGSSRSGSVPNSPSDLPNPSAGLLGPPSEAPELENLSTQAIEGSVGRLSPPDPPAAFRRHSRRSQDSVLRGTGTHLNLAISTPLSLLYRNSISISTNSTDSNLEGADELTGQVLTENRLEGVQETPSKETSPHGTPTK